MQTHKGLPLRYNYRRIGCLVADDRHHGSGRLRIQTESVKPAQGEQSSHHASEVFAIRGACATQGHRPPAQFGHVFNRNWQSCDMSSILWMPKDAFVTFERNFIPACYPVRNIPVVVYDVKTTARSGRLSHRKAFASGLACQSRYFKSSPNSFTAKSLSSARLKRM